MFWGFSLGPVTLAQPEWLLANQGQRQARLSSWGQEVPSLALLGGLFQPRTHRLDMKSDSLWESALASGTDAVNLSFAALSCR